MVTGLPLINGVSFTFADLQLMIFGVPIIGLTGISYMDEQVMQANYSAGSKLPTSVGFGNITFDCSITMTMEAVQAIRKVAPNGRLQNIPFFPVGINFLPDSGLLVRHVLKNCRFKGTSQAPAPDQSQIEVTLPLFVSDIDYNA